MLGSWEILFMPLFQVGIKHMPWSRAAPHCCLGHRLVFSFCAEASGRHLSPPSGLGCLQVQELNHTLGLELCHSAGHVFEFPDSKFLEADGHLTVDNLGSVVSKSLINPFLLVGPGMLVIPSSFLLSPGPCVFWTLIFQFLARC